MAKERLQALPVPEVSEFSPRPFCADDSTEGLSMSSGDPDTEKYIEVLQCLLDPETGANNEHLGKVKLMKLLYYADFEHFAKHGRSITGDVYRKLDFGPVPRNAPHVLDTMVQRELVRIRQEHVISYAKYAFQLLEPLGKPQHLSEDEIQTLREVVAKWGNHSREEIVAASHGEPPWQLTSYGEDIPYELVHYRRNVGATENDEEPEPMPLGPSPYWRSSWPRP